MQFPDLRTVPQRRTNLPATPPRLIGRDQQTGDIIKQLSAGSLVTLVGTGGVGKTSVAIRVASEVIDDYPDGVWMVELAAVGDATAVADAMAAVLGVKKQAGLAIEENLASVIAGRDLLVVLDNCEHVVDAAASLIERLLAGSPGLTVLATSRERLGVAAEQVWPLPPLDLTDGFASPAVELFLERAAAVAPGFERHAKNDAGVIAEICKQLDGLPLAIELAAARMVSMTAQEVHNRLDDRFRLLARSRRSSDRRQPIRQFPTFRRW
jgi:predicted ATPase